MDLKPDQYRGSLKDFEPEGYGEYLFTNTFYKYQGDWKGGKKHGLGKLLFKDGSYYEGEFKDDEINGIGTYYDSHKGTEYSGQWWMGEKHGKGLLKYSDGSHYNGEWEANLCQGYGFHVSKEDDRYEGNFYKNKKHGEGTLTYNDGSSYEGNWVGGRQQGHGVRRYPNGSSYKGQWRCGWRHGMGHLLHVSGYSYEGLWRNDKPIWFPIKLQLILASPGSTIPLGGTFSLVVHCLDENKVVCDLDEGRSVRLIAGVVEKDESSVERIHKREGFNEKMISGDEDKDEEKEGNEDDEEGSIFPTETEAYVKKFLGITMKEVQLLKSSLELHDPVYESKEPSVVNSEETTESNSTENNEDDTTKSAEDESQENDARTVETEEDCVGAKVKVTEFYTQFANNLRTSQGRVMVEGLMLAISDEHVLANPHLYKAVVVVFDTTCPTFMNYRLKSDFLIKELVSAN